MLPERKIDRRATAYELNVVTADGVTKTICTTSSHPTHYMVVAEALMVPSDYVQLVHVLPPRLWVFGIRFDPFGSDAGFHKIVTLEVLP